MRFYQTFPIALNEIKRDLREMGVLTKTQSVQNIVGEVATYEVQNYIYTVTQPDWHSIEVPNQFWCDAEFAERISGESLNPGEAWKLRAGYWKRFLNPIGKFDYAYPERMVHNLRHVINALKKDINTRRAFLPIIDIIDDEADRFDHRFPCSLGYWFKYQQDRLSMTYLLRSSDFLEHFVYDVQLANRLQCYVADQVGVKPGVFCHWIGSLHCFQNDPRIVGVF